MKILVLVKILNFEAFKFALPTKNVPFYQEKCIRWIQFQHSRRFKFQILLEDTRIITNHDTFVQNTIYYFSNLNKEFHKASCSAEIKPTNKKKIMLLSLISLRDTI